MNIINLNRDLNQICMLHIRRAENMILNVFFLIILLFQLLQSANGFRQLTQLKICHSSKYRLDSNFLRLNDDSDLYSVGFSPFHVRSDVETKNAKVEHSITNSSPQLLSISFSPLLLLLLFYPMIVVANENISGGSGRVVNLFDPSKFQPVCPLSDGVYGGLKTFANVIVGQDNVDQYGPLISSVLLRIRLEICVLESFLNEAVIPFVQKNGVSWVLPAHETVETFLAGSFFAIACNFILIGTTKILSILFIYLDTLTGMPTRFIGQGIKKIDNKKNVIGILLQIYGDIVGNTRNIIEGTDIFVGRYLVLTTSLYIAFKFVHFKFFNDISF